MLIYDIDISVDSLQSRVLSEGNLRTLRSMTDNSRKTDLARALYGARRQAQGGESEKKHKFWGTQPVPQDGSKFD